jgi:integrase/recombinase XerD
MNNADKLLYKSGRPIGTGKGSARPLSIREVRSLYSSCLGRNGIRNQAIITLQLHAGMRVGEVFGLSLSQVCNKEGKVKASIIISGRNMKGKTSHTYYLSNMGREILKGYISTIDTSNPEAPLFPSPKSQDFISPNSGAQLVRNLIKKAGIEDASSHSLRSSFARKLLDKGVGIETISKALAHKNLSTTVSYLGNIAPKAENAVMDITF